MTTLVTTNGRDDALAQAAALLRMGKLVAFPTETVYGLGADATNEKAVASIFTAKGRPSFNPLIVHVTSFEALHDIVVVNAVARQLAAAFMPGPLTLVLPRKENCGISWLASAGLETLAVRAPSHPVAQALLKETARPLAAPSANISGAVSPTTPLHVMESLGGKIDMVLCAGRCSVGIESTVLDLTTQMPTLLRPGGIPREALESVIGSIQTAAPISDQPNAPGQLESHYAPRARVRLNAHNARDDEALLAFGPVIQGAKTMLNLSEKCDLHEAAANLFAMLRELDQPDIKTIAVMPIPETGLGAAINDRLTRAAAPRL